MLYFLDSSSELEGRDIHSVAAAMMATTADGCHMDAAALLSGDIICLPVAVPYLSGCPAYHCVCVDPAVSLTFNGFNGGIDTPPQPRWPMEEITRNWPDHAQCPKTCRSSHSSHHHLTLHLACMSGVPSPPPVTAAAPTKSNIEPAPGGGATSAAAAAAGRGGDAGKPPQQLHPLEEETPQLPQEEGRPRPGNAPAMQQEVVGTTTVLQQQDLQLAAGMQSKGQQVCFSARTSQIPYVKQIVGALKVSEWVHTSSRMDK